jgi:hypothetical protein
MVGTFAGASDPAAETSAAASSITLASWNIGLRGLGKLCSTDRVDEYGPADVHGIRRKQSYGESAPAAPPAASGGSALRAWQHFSAVRNYLRERNLRRRARLIP